jgi:hypothetical protein
MQQGLRAPLKTSIKTSKNKIKKRARGFLWINSKSGKDCYEFFSKKSSTQLPSFSRSKKSKSGLAKR